MYERFTDRARKVMQLANQEAQKLNHEYIGTEHILLGLIRDGGGVANNVLRNLDVNPQKVRCDVEGLLNPGPKMVTMGKIPFTTRVTKVIEYTLEEARNLNLNYVGTEHILLGLMREPEGIAGKVLHNHGLTLEKIHQEAAEIVRAGMNDGGVEGQSQEMLKSISDNMKQMSSSWNVSIEIPKRTGAGLYVIRSTNDRTKYWTAGTLWADKPAYGFNQLDVAAQVSALMTHESFQPFEIVELMI